MGFDVHNPVFGTSAGLIVLFLIGTLLVDSESAKSVLDGLKWQIIGAFDWLFIWAGNIFVIFCLALIVSPFGKIRIGGKDATADHSFHVLASNAICCRYGCWSYVLERC
ncbi:BCCT family transporter [Vibrio hannami]|uniref:BCCT family transporter n=1 Tax=Vibrio hannami TaxID=2717094 RepID=UPI00241006DD|nr:BCCT family transporter [Vibrio hannami]MDG3088433.1 BCCT family transporter [Vibrio hannami]